MPDSATQLVRAYLHVNGYFAATEYPLVEKSSGKAPRSVTVHRDEVAAEIKAANEAASKGTAGKPKGLPRPPKRT